ncbi:MAG: hypothetical protein IJI61_07795 [Oscillospiraceae bacterium]|nr:hypothetical protein [Oscillospiraceae bacterium]
MTNPTFEQIRSMTYQWFPLWISVLYLFLFIASSLKCFAEEKSFPKIILLAFFSPAALTAGGTAAGKLLSSALRTIWWPLGRQFVTISEKLTDGALKIAFLLLGLLFYLMIMKPKNKAFGVFVFLSALTLQQIDCSISRFSSFLAVRFFYPTVAALAVFVILQAVLFMATIIAPLSDLSCGEQPVLSHNWSILPLLPLSAFAVLLLANTMQSNTLYSANLLYESIRSYRAGIVETVGNYLSNNALFVSSELILLLLVADLALIWLSDKTIQNAAGINRLEQPESAVDPQVVQGMLDMIVEEDPPIPADREEAEPPEPEDEDI